MFPCFNYVIKFLTIYSSFNFQSPKDLLTLRPPGNTLCGPNYI